MECDPRGLGARPEVCQRLAIRAYPTWVIGPHRVEGVMSLDELARLSGFRSATQPGG